jgi:hypothetical protein
MSRKASPKPLWLTAAYDLREVKRLVRAGKYKIVGKVVETAARDFGWDVPEVVRFYLALRASHFCKRAPAEHWDTDWLDVYRAEMFGHKVYTHFFVDDQGELVIVNSFKADTSGEPIP